MALPDRIQVRISSEAAGAISLTPVVNQSIALRELVEVILATTGKDSSRVRELLLRGAVVQGASRFRWEALVAGGPEVEALLKTFPDADPSRRFSVARCARVRIRAGRQAIELPREVASKRRFLKRRSFWDELMALAERSKLEYVDYSYRTRTDEYRVPLATEEAASLRGAAGLLTYSGLAMQLRESPLEFVEYSVRYP